MTRSDGRWTSLEAHGLYEHKSAAGALYRAVLRAEVRDRLPWVWWRASGRGLFEIDGVPQPVLREFSRRRVEIEERARELTGVAASSLSRERLQGIALATRKAKVYGVDGARWQEEARARAAEHGLGKRELDRLRATSPRSPDRSEADVVRSAANRLSGADGLTAQHNTFAGRHAVAEIAGEFTQGASVAQVQHGTRKYLDHASVVPLGLVDDESRFSTRDLLACEQAIVDGAGRRAVERRGLLHQRLPDLVLAQLNEPLTSEQSTAARALVSDGQGVSVLQALAGTGKTRVLAAVARVYESGGYHVVGVAPTGRAAREVADTAGIPASTVHRLLADLDESGGFRHRTVVLFDEAGSAPTRPSAALFAHAERCGAKVIAVGDSGQLPSVAAGGWFAALTDALGGPELREVMRQRDQAERDALEQLHDGDPDGYIELKCQRDELAVHEHEADAVAAILADWNQAQQQHGLRQAVMIARDNTTRAALNEHARQLLIHAGKIAPEGVTIADQEFRVGDRVIARRNDRYRDIDNGTLASITDIDPHTGTLTVITDTDEPRRLDASYAAEHLEPAYALTGHGAQGATVQWAGVIGRAFEFTREWAYTSLSRARDQTRAYVIAEATESQHDREQYAPPEPQRTATEALEIITRAIRRREAETLATQQLDQTDMPGIDKSHVSLTPLTKIMEAGADHAARQANAREFKQHRRNAPRPEPDWQRARQRARDPNRGHGREM
jgi:hypothetical protein